MISQLKKQDQPQKCMNDWWHWIVLFRLNRKESFEKYGFHVDRSSLFILRFYASLTPGDTMVSLISPTPSLCYPPSPRYEILVPNDTLQYGLPGNESWSGVLGLLQWKVLKYKVWFVNLMIHAFFMHNKV